MAESSSTQLSTRHRVRGTEIDASGAMPVSGVARLCENTRWEIFGLDDFPLRGAMERGVVRASVFQYLEPMRRSEEIEVYIRETHAGERVQMESWVTAPDRRAFELTRLDSAELLCRGQIQCASPTPSS